MDESDAGTNNSLSQSYAQGVKRISNFPYEEEFGLVQQPPEIIEEREKTWDKLFEKYSEQLSDEIELNLNSSSEVDEAQEEEGEEEEDAEDEEEDENDEEDEDEFFSASRAPMRKSRDLIQYWVDTGNHPHKLLDSESESGSSLSEEDYVPMPMPKLYPVVIPPTPRVHQETSNNSSVDTAAYILSNTNITNKSDTMVILEGSRGPKDPLENPQSSQPQLDSPLPQESEEGSKTNEQNCDNNNLSLNASPDVSTILSRLGETIREKSFDRSRLNSCESDDSEDSEVKATMASSMRIADVLPTLAKLDELRAQSNINGFRKDSGESSGRATPKSLTLSKKTNRRKLYTGRNSPMDIIISSMNSEDQIVPKSGSLHPAFQGTPKPKIRVSYLKTRATLNLRRKSKLLLLPGTSENSKESSEGAPGMKEKTFMKRLGLVPSPSFNTRSKRKIISGVVRRSPRKRQMRMIIKDDVESDSEEDQSSVNSMRSSVAGEKSGDLLSLCNKKLLSVPLERLPEEVLRGFSENNDDKSEGIIEKGVEKDFEGEKVDKMVENELGDELNPKADVNPTKSDVITSKKIKKNSQSQKIELDSQESDQSTIIMIHCENKNEKSAPTTRSKKIVNSGKSQKTVENNELVPVDEKEGKTTLSTPQTRSKKSSSDSNHLQTSVENKKSVLRDANLSSPQTRSRKSISDSDKPREIVENGTENQDLASSDRKMKKKLTNRTIRILRSRSAQKNKEQEEKKRKSRKVNAKKVRVKHSNDKIELLDEIDRTREDSSAPGEVQENQDGGDEEKESENGGDKSLTIGTITVTIDSDSYSDSSRIKRPRRTINESRRRFSKPIITFSSDDESGFIKRMERSFEKFERKSKKKPNVGDELTEDQRKIIDDLTGETVQIFFGNIVDSDEEEITEGLKVEVKARSGKSGRNGMSNVRKSASTVKSQPKSTRNSKRVSIVRVLSFDDTSSKQSEEMNESPSKRLKTENGAVNKSGKNNVSRNINTINSSKGVESDSNASSSDMLLERRSTRSSGVKRKADFDENCIQGSSPTDAIKSPIKVTRILSPVVKLLRQSPVDKLASPIKSPAEKPQSVIKSPDKRLSSTKSKLSDVKLMDLSISIKKIPKDLEKSFENNSKESSPVVSPNKSMNHSRKMITSVKKITRSSKRRPLTSDDDSSVDFFIQKSTEINDKLIEDDSSDNDSTKCTKLFYNPFEDSGEELTISMNKNYKRKRSSKNVNINFRKQSVMTFRTRDNSDSDD